MQSLIGYYWDVINKSLSDAGVTRISATSQSCWLTPVQLILLASIHGDRHCCNALNGARHMAPQGVEKAVWVCHKGCTGRLTIMACGSTYIYVFYQLGNERYRDPL